MEMANKKKRLALEDVSNEYDTQKNIGGNKRAKCPSIVQPSLKLPNKLVKPKTTTTAAAVRSKKREAAILGTKKPAVEKQKLSSAAKRRKSCNIDNLVNPIERLTVNLGCKVDESNAVVTAATRRKATAACKTSTTTTVAATKTAPSNQQQQQHQQQHPSKPFKQPIPAKIDSLVSSSSIPDNDDDVDDDVIDDGDDVEIVCVQPSVQLQDVQQQQQQQQQTWVDVDVGTSIYYLPNYVNDIFDYYRDREVKFRIPDYMSRQTDLTASMRAILVDWLVEVQQSFELNHETLYMAVKLIDIFSSKVTIKRNKLQLVGAVALNLACKFEERCPPMLDDFVYVCDDAYPRQEFLKMEELVFQAVDFDIGLPLSYTFLRRFATCGRANLKTLTLSRFLLESSLMDYQFVVCLDSVLACACLFIAMCMNQDGSWDDTIYHYTQYRPIDFEEIVYKLNDMICSPPEPNLTTILSKYSHPVFLEVAKIDKLTNEQLRAIIHF